MDFRIFDGYDLRNTLICSDLQSPDACKAFLESHHRIQECRWDYVQGSESACPTDRRRWHYEFTCVREKNGTRGGA